jgi:hypothetical protein
MKIITTSEKRKYERVSRWITLHSDYVTKRHGLADYSDFSADPDSPDWGLLNYFTYKGKKYALGQFMRLTYPEFFEDEEGKSSYLSGYDCTDYYNPLICEIHESGEMIRLYRSVPDEEYGHL